MKDTRLLTSSGPLTERTIIGVVVLLGLCALSNAQQNWVPWAPLEWSPWKPPWENFDDSVVVRTYNGWVKGFSVPWHIDDEYWNPKWQEYPPWFMRRINCFLGVPYAEPPLGELRFQRPRMPRSMETFDATYYRPACPQKLDEIRRDIPDFPLANVSEDCLYLNIFVPNITNHDADLSPDRNLYPVMVWFHSGDFTYGTSQQQPGHVLVTRRVVVVTLNYRLGALGFLSTEDEHASGNWGMFDQQMALEYIKENIRSFRGDPDKITIMGDGAGAASVGLHLVSAASRDKGFYHQCVMMSGTDLSMAGFLNPFWRPREYASRLAEMLDCTTEDSYAMIECLRNNKTIPWQAILEAQERVAANDGDLGMVWGPTQDGGFYRVWPFLPHTPSDLRHQEEFEKVPCIIGFNTHDGAKKANDSVLNLGDGMYSQTFKDFVSKMLLDWRVLHDWRQRAVESIEFQYTYWPVPDNTTARAQEFIQMVTDLHVGSPMDEVIKIQAVHENVYMYQFNYKSWNDYLPNWMGISFSAAVPYIFGVPFMNETVLNQSEIVPRQWYDYDDRNMSDWMMYMWTNFVKYGEPTPNITRNITWDPFNFDNLSYLAIQEYSHVWYRYRQDKYGYWNDYFPLISKRDYLYPTATPTPAGYEYVISTGALSALMIVLFCALAVVMYFLWFAKDESHADPYRDTYGSSDLPLSFTTGQSRSQSQTSLARKSPMPTHSVV